MLTVHGPQAARRVGSKSHAGAKAKDKRGGKEPNLATAVVPSGQTKDRASDSCRAVSAQVASITHAPPPHLLLDRRRRCLQYGLSLLALYKRVAAMLTRVEDRTLRLGLVEQAELSLERLEAEH